MENWVNVVGFEGLYEVSDMGAVRRIAPWSDGRKTKPADRLIGAISHNGYHRVTLRMNNAPKQFAAHCLVAAAFIGDKPSPRHQVNHINGIKTDNRPCNLEYVTPSENQYHSYRVLGSTRRPGSKHHANKVVESDVIAMREAWASGVTQKELGAKYGLSPGTVCWIIKRKAWKHV